MLNKDNLDVDRLYTSVWKLLRSNDDIYLVEDALAIDNTSTLSGWFMYEVERVKSPLNDTGVYFKDLNILDQALYIKRGIAFFKSC
tara:strand:+ start:159 stop:416 length:258 start_codon:yes stop_codon:yes gene_type:complete